MPSLQSHNAHAFIDSGSIRQRATARSLQHVKFIGDVTLDCLRNSILSRVAVKITFFAVSILEFTGARWLS